MDSEIKEKEALREKVLGKAEELFRQYGIRSVTMNDIARKLGISKKTIYLMFRDKTELVRIVTQRMCEQDHQEMENVRKIASDAIDSFMRWTENLKKIFEELNPSLIYDIEKYYPASYEIHQEYKEKFHSYFLENMKRGIKEGLFRPEINVEILSVLWIQEVTMATDEKIFPRDKFDLFTIYLETTEHFLRGIVTLEGFQRLEAYHKQNMPNHTNHEKPKY